MKKFLTAIIALFFVTAIQAQSFNTTDATTELTKIYNLDAQQQDEMAVIQERKARNLAEIQTLKTSDYDTYIKKLKSLQFGTDASIKRILNKEQIEVFYKQNQIRRKKEADLMQKMKAEGATPEQINAAVAEMY